LGDTEFYSLEERAGVEVVIVVIIDSGIIIVTINRTDLV